jgi:hypothetical protein
MPSPRFLICCCSFLPLGTARPKPSARKMRTIDMAHEGIRLPTEVGDAQAALQLPGSLMGASYWGVSSIKATENAIRAVDPSTVQRIIMSWLVPGARTFLLC